MIPDTLVPPAAIVIAIPGLGEVFTALQALGAVATLGGVVLTRFAPGKEGRSSRDSSIPCLCRPRLGEFDHAMRA